MFYFYIFFIFCWNRLRDRYTIKINIEQKIKSTRQRDDNAQWKFNRKKIYEKIVSRSKMGRRHTLGWDSWTCIEISGNFKLRLRFIVSFFPGVPDPTDALLECLYIRNQSAHGTLEKLSSHETSSHWKMYQLLDADFSTSSLQSISYRRNYFFSINISEDISLIFEFIF